MFRTGMAFTNHFWDWDFLRLKISSLNFSPSLTATALKFCMPVPNVILHCHTKFQSSGNKIFEEISKMKIKLRLRKSQSQKPLVKATLEHYLGSLQRQTFLAHQSLPFGQTPTPGLASGQRRACVAQGTGSRSLAVSAGAGSWRQTGLWPDSCRR